MLMHADNRSVDHLDSGISHARILLRGNFSDATECFQIARGLDPSNPLNFMSSIGIGTAHFDAGRYEEGAVWFGRAIAEHPEAVWANRFRAPRTSAGWQKGRGRKGIR